MKVFASHNPNSEIRRNSSSGGVFSILAENTLRNGGVVYGVAFDEHWNIAHRRIDTVEGLAALRGSKYAFSRVGEAYADAIVDLEAGRQVLFSGTPCQIAAMRKRVGETPNLLLIEIVCHGAPKHEYWTRYLAELCQIQGKTTQDIFSINFRDKRTGWKNYSFTIRFADGKEFSQPYDDNLYLRAFLKDLTIRDACFKCPFKYPNGSRADITIGDFWGINQLAPDLDNDSGTTIVVARTEKGLRKVGNIECLRHFQLEDICRYNPAIISSPALLPYIYEFREEVNKKDKLIPVMKKYAARPLSESIYLKWARRLIHKILHK